MAAGLLGGGFVFRISKSLLLGSAAALACIRLGTVLANEPGHPQQVVLVLLMLSSCLSLSAGSGRKGTSLFLLGAVGAALIFTKINVGVFYIAALAHTLLCLLRPSRVRTVGLGFMLAYAVMTPALLMHSNFLNAPVYCLIALLSGGVTFACGSLVILDTSLPLRRALYAGAGIILATAFIVIAAVSQGMSVRTLVEGVLLDPAKQPQVFSRGLWIGPRHFLVAVLTVSCIGAMCLFRGRLATLSNWIGALRCAVGLMVVVFLLLPGLSLGDSLLPLPRLALCYAFLPLSVIPLVDRKWGLSDLLPRLFITDLAVTQFLQAYPVAGSQVSIAAAPMLLWGLVSIFDGVDEFHGLGKWGSRSLLKTILGGLIILALSVAMSRSVFSPHGHLYPQSNLSGSASLHLPPEQEKEYLFLASSIHENCNLLFSMPGMDSFNFWSGVPTPNGWNLTAWMRGFSLERQKGILDILQSNPRACVLYNKELVRFWGSTAEELSASPLASYITHGMPRVAEEGGYEIRVNPRRNVPWTEVSREVVPISSRSEKR
jgi:F0F1-type ATP synthase membrane subunit c/vacuolar-type H+-ATPase subunit K